MNKFEKWKESLTLEELKDLAWSDFSCNKCPAEIVCRASKKPCRETIMKWGEQDD